MGSSVTITPDTAPNPITITPDADKRTWWDSVSDFGKELWRQVNPVAGAQGAATAVTHPIDTLKSDAASRKAIYDNAEEAFKKGNYAEGAGHLLYAALPFVGPQLDEAGNNFLKGNYAKGAGQSVGMGLNLAGPEAAKGLNIKLPGSAPAAERMYQSALKPSTTLGAVKIGNVVKTGLENEIPVSAGGLSKLGDLLDDVNDKIKAEIAAAPNRPINKFKVASRLGDTAQKFATQVNPEADLNAVSESGNEFLKNQPSQIPASDAQALKQGTYQQLKSRAYGELKSASVESQKALARGLKEELATKFPELAQLNAQDSKLIDLDGVLEKAVNRVANHQLGGIGTPLAAAGAKAVTGSTGAAAVSGVIKAVIDNPIVKSHLAIALNKASQGKITLPMATARLEGYVNALGSAANASATKDQGNQ